MFCTVRRFVIEPMTMARMIAEGLRAKAKYLAPFGDITIVRAAITVAPISGCSVLRHHCNVPRTYGYRIGRAILRGPDLVRRRWGQALDGDRAVSVALHTRSVCAG